MMIALRSLAHALESAITNTSIPALVEPLEQAVPGASFWSKVRRTSLLRFPHECLERFPT